MTDEEVMLLGIGAIFCVVVCLILYLINQKYVRFVKDHSLAYREISELNKSYSFYKIPNLDIKHKYDNEIFYSTISPTDYLIYHLSHNSIKISEAVKQAHNNHIKYEKYMLEIAKCAFDRYDEEITLLFPFFLKLKERKMVKNLIAQPTTEFRLNVVLIHTKINGRYVTSKEKTFNGYDIQNILSQLTRTNDGYYIDTKIWNAICRVERGRVSNKMRFKIYERDRHRCCKCGARHTALEIDHIFPVSKGGKSTYDNLQTLCHKCNQKKSNFIEKDALIPQNVRNNMNYICPNCNIPMVLRHGRYGDFYGCMNYPSCKHTEQIR